MKKWVKAHGRLILSIIYLLVIGNGIYGAVLAVKADNDLYFVIYIFCTSTFILMFLWLSGIWGKISAWWQRD